jgi:hypothetical protein
LYIKTTLYTVDKFEDEKNKILQQKQQQVQATNTINKNLSTLIKNKKSLFTINDYKNMTETEAVKNYDKFDQDATEHLATHLGIMNLSGNLDDLRDRIQQLLSAPAPPSTPPKPPKGGKNPTNKQTRIPLGPGRQFYIPEDVKAMSPEQRQRDYHLFTDEALTKYAKFLKIAHKSSDDRKTLNDLIDAHFNQKPSGGFKKSSSKNKSHIKQLKYYINYYYY